MNHPRLPEQLSEESQQRRAAKETRCRNEYLKGPIRLVWLHRVLRLPRKAIATALALAFKAGVSGETKDIPLTPQLLEKFGVSRRSSYRVLEDLEQAGLVTVKRHRGRAPRVTIVKGFNK